MVDWLKIKEMAIKIWKFKIEIPDYVFNKNIFRIGIALIFFWLLFAGFNYGWDWSDEIYFSCNDENGCENPWYAPKITNDFGLVVPCVNPIPGRDPDLVLCSKEFFNPGETYGKSPDFWTLHAADFSLLIVVCMLLLNHFKFNKGYFRRKRLELKQMEDGEE